MSFIQFINESEDKEITFCKNVASSLIDKIRDSRSMDNEVYISFSGMEFTEPFMFDLILNVKRNANPKAKSDSHFNDLPWEDLNFKEKGYMIDANTKMNKKETLVPKIEFHILLNPKKEPSCYNRLYHRLVDILLHETNHLNQVGINREHPNTRVSSQEERKKAKKSNAYFLLPEEIESMVDGMYARAVEEDKFLDEVFFKYLEPFVKTDYITTKEFEITMRAWITHAIEKHPDVKLSPKADIIIKSI